MEQQIVNNTDFSPDEFDADELEVAEFLLQMGSTILRRSSWACKRKRSALLKTQSSQTQTQTPCNGKSEKPIVNPSVNRSCNREKKPIVDKVERSSPETPLSFIASEEDSKPSNPSNGERPIVKKVEKPSFVTPLSFSPNEAESKLSNPSNGEKPIVAKVENPSHVTPISFSPSDSDYGSKRSKIKIVKKKSNKDTLEKTILTLSKRREVLRKTIKSVKAHYKNLKIQKKNLKAAQLELSLRLDERNPNFNSYRTTIGPDNLVEPTHIPTIATEEQEPIKVPTIATEEQEPIKVPTIATEDQEPIKVYQPEPSINNKTTLVAKILEKSKPHPYGQMPPLLSSGGACVKELSPLGIPDLNIKVEEAEEEDETFEMTAIAEEEDETFEMTAIACAQARKRRYELNKEKKEKKKGKSFMDASTSSTRS